MKCICFVFKYLLVFCILPAALAQTPKIDSLRLASQAEEISREERINTLIDLAFWLSMEQLPMESIESLDEAKNYMLPEDSLRFYPSMCQEYTRSYYLLGQFVNALSYVPQLENFADIERARMLEESSVGTPLPSQLLNTADSYAIIGEIYRKIGHFDKALDFALRAKEIAELLGKSYIVANTYNNIGIIYAKMDNLRESNSYYRKALTLNKQLNREAYRGSNYMNIGINYKNANQLDSAYYYYRKALQYYKAPYGVGTIYNSIGMLFFKKENYDSAEYYYQQALTIQRNNSYLEQMSYSLIRLAEIYNSTGRYNQALTAAERSFQINKQEKSNDLMHQSALELSVAYERLEDLENSLQYYKIHKQFHDSVYNQTKQEELARQQVRFSTKEKEKENELLRREAELNQVKIRSQYLVGAFLILLTFLSFYLLLVTRKRNKARQELQEQKLKNEQMEKQFLEKELSFKNKELINFALQIVEKNDFLSEVTREVERWMKNGLKSNEKVKELSKKLKANEIINKHRVEFDAHVNSVYESFYRNLEEKFPGLTPNEKRMAALLRLKLSSKEISSVIGISSKSVDMSRYRLRKKLELTNEDNLIDVLNLL